MRPQYEYFNDNCIFNFGECPYEIINGNGASIVAGLIREATAGPTAWAPGDGGPTTWAQADGASGGYFLALGNIV